MKSQKSDTLARMSKYYKYLEKLSNACEGCYYFSLPLLFFSLDVLTVAQEITLSINAWTWTMIGISFL